MLRVRRRPWAFGLIVVLSFAVASLFAGPWAYADESAAPTVTFTSNGAPPVTCHARPDVHSLTVPEGTAILIANHTEVRAAVIVGGATVLTVNDGEGALLTLAPGQHEVSVQPECRVTTAARSLAVTVTAVPPAQPTAPTVPPTVTGSGSGGTPVRSSTPPATTATTSATGGAPATTDVPANWTSPSPGSTPSAGAPTLGPSSAPPWPDVVRADVVALPDGAGNSKGVRLLAAIATICVLGVTAAVIRSIVRLDA